MYLDQFKSFWQYLIKLIRLNMNISSNRSPDAIYLGNKIFVPSETLSNIFLYLVQFDYLTLYLLAL